MKTIFAKTHGVIPNTDVTKPLAQLLKSIDCAEETELVFEPGEYKITAKDCETVTAYMTNSMGKSEWKDDETPYSYRFAIDLQGKKNLTIIGNGALFLVDGQATNLRLDGCENVLIKNIAFDAVNPNCHLFTVTKASPTKVWFTLSKESKYEKSADGNYYFVGKDYRKAFIPDPSDTSWDGKMNPSDNDTCYFAPHLLSRAKNLVETAPYEFCFTKSIFRKIRAGERYIVVDIRRRNAGILINDCKNVTFENIKQHYNYGLAVVAQNVQNLTVSDSVFAPRNNMRYLTSVADFLQICMCRGDVTIKNCRFEGSGDDCLNVHGHHLKVQNKAGNNVTVRFMHSQSLGFNAFHKGDKIDFVSPNTLLSYGSATVLDSKMLSDTDILLELDDASALKLGDVVENVSANPNMYFIGNTINRVMTRGLLLTTCGKILIENNVFNNTYLNSLLFEGDAKTWYESGKVVDATIINNTFLSTHGFNAFFNPNTTKHVHQNIRFVSNKFNSAPRGGFLMRCAANVTFEGNSYKRKPRFYKMGALNIKKDF